jgi:hypothetical protein
MSKVAHMVAGVVAFSNLTKHDFYNGKDTGNFTLTITMDEANASVLEDLGVQVKDYKDKKQRKFKSQFNVPVIDMDDNPVTTEIPFGSEVRVLFATGNPNAEYGVPVYMNKIRLVELGEGDTPEEF